MQQVNTMLNSRYEVEKIEPNETETSEKCKESKTINFTLKINDLESDSDLEIEDKDQYIVTGKSLKKKVEKERKEQIDAKNL